MDKTKNNVKLEPFLKIWRNIVIRYKIIEQLKIYKYSFLNSKFTIEQLYEHKFREYLTKLILIEKKQEQKHEQQQQALKKYIVPNSLEVLYIKTNIIIEKDVIKENLKVIEFGNQFKEINFNFIPKSIKNISFSGSTKPIIPNEGLDLYFNLIQLTIDSNSYILLNHSSCFPNLKKLVINDYRGEITIPSTVTSLVFGHQFNKQLPSIPSTINEVFIGSSLKKKFPLSQLPCDLELLSIRDFKVSKFEFDEFKIFPQLRILLFVNCNDNEMDFSNAIDILPSIQLIVFNDSEYSRSSLERYKVKKLEKLKKTLKLKK